MQSDFPLVQAFEIQLRLSPFCLIQGANGPTTPSPNQAQTPESLPETQEQSGSGEPAGTDQVAVQEADAGAAISATMPAGRYLIVDGHSVIFAWPELVQMHRRRSAPARERLIKCLRDYQDWTGVRVVVVFDGTGSTVSNSADPGDIQIFYSAQGQTADSVVERLASKYASQFDVTVATSDALERETVAASGAETISPEMLRSLIGELRDQHR
jgi:predicted RNA-binding protein with PIN domain